MDSARLGTPEVPRAFASRGCTPIGGQAWQPVWRCGDEVVKRIDPRSFAVYKRLQSITSAHIVPVAVTAGDDPHVSMPFVGESLESMLARGAQINTRLVLRSLLLALLALHAAGIAHGDVKPANILHSAHTNSFVLTDFDSAGLCVQGVCQTFGYTKAYAAPEQLTDDPRRAGKESAHPITTAVDIWAAGMTAAALAYHADSRPYNAWQFVHGAAIPAAEARRRLRIPLSVGKTLRIFVARCTHFDHNQRPSARALLNSTFFIE